MSLRSFWTRLLHGMHRALLWSDRHLPRGLRALCGIVLVILGPFGFLPVLGFWMLPLGLGLIALEVPPWRRRLLSWLERRRPDGQEGVP